MTDQAERGVESRPGSGLLERWFPWQKHDTGLLLALAVVPPLVLGVLAWRGGWYADDLDFLVHGRRGFALEDILAPVNDHIVPGLRLAYAALALVDGPSWGLSVLVRAVLWYAAVVLMAGLVARLTEVRWAPLLAVAVYGLSSLTMPSFMSLSSAVNTIPAQVAGLVVVHATLDWFEDRQWRDLVVITSALFVAMCFWEKSGLVVLTAVAAVIVVGVATDRDRWLGWVAAVALGGGGFTLLYLATSSASTTWPAPGTALQVVLQGMSRTMLPSLVGGPWDWVTTQPPYFGVADPGVVTILVGGLLAAVGVWLAWRFARRVVALWLAAALFAVVGAPVVAAGRYASFGELITRHHHYWADAAIPVSLAVVCTVAAVAGRPRGVVLPRVLLPAAVASAAVWGIGTVVSWSGFAGPWADNPSREYLATLTEQVEGAAPVVLWDSQPPLEVMPYISANRRVSNLVELTGVAGAEFLPTGNQPWTVDDDGMIRPSRMRVWAELTPKKKEECVRVVKGATEVHIPLGKKLSGNLWSIRLGYLASPESVVRVETEDDTGRRAPLRGDQRWEAGLSTAHLMTEPETSIRALVVSTKDPAANICVGNVEVGVIEVLR